MRQWKTKSDRLYDECVALLRRDLEHLKAEVGKGKLTHNAARDLVSYMKLLKDVKAQEAEQRTARAKAKAEKKATLTDEQLEALANGPPKEPNPAPSKPDKT